MTFDLYSVICHWWSSVAVHYIMFIACGSINVELLNHRRNSDSSVFDVYMIIVVH